MTVLSEHTAPAAAPETPATPAPPASVPRRLWLAVELFALFGVLPFLIPMGVIPLAWAFRVLFIATAIIVVWLLLDKRFDNRNLWRPSALARQWKRIALLYIPALLVMSSVTVAAERGFIASMAREQSLLFAFPISAPIPWLIVMLLYPIFSAYPQEIIYRCFFFHRYRALFPRPEHMVVASTIAFAWLHVPFLNGVVIILALVAGLMFSWTYMRTRSGFVVGLEHALYGDAIFTIGLGYFFCTGSVGA